MKNWRFNLIFIFIIIFGAAIIGRLVYIQIIKHDLYKAWAQGQQKIFQPVKGDRGDIFFSGGEILATNLKAEYLFASPYEVKEKEKTADQLAQILNLEKETILAKLEKDTLFEKIKTNLTVQEKEAIEEMNMTGIYLREALFRNYPQESMASQVVGFLGGQEKGQYGIEGHYDNLLQGEEMIQRKEKGSIGSFFSEMLQGSYDGTDLYLTLDYNIQFMAEQLLVRVHQDLDIEAGQIIVIDPSSGKILALANFPNFNPNDYSEIEDFDIFQNGAIQKLYEPGSSFKPITMAAGIDQGKITPRTTYLDEGKVKIGKYTIENYNSRVFGEKTMTEVLEKSINTGAVFAEKQLGHDLFLDYIDSFGFFKPTEIDLQGEVFSENKIFKRGYEINFATASFGQGIEITPIQLVRAFSAIANEGKLVKPYLVERIIKQGEEIDVSPKKSSEQVISSKTASQLTAMLISVVENGFAKSAGIPEYYIAGKTGTAQVPEEGVYSADKTWQSFIGFGPAFNPRFLILVKLDNPKTRTAEYSALPLFKELAKYIIDYYKIPPDYK
jgi:cell division protein FtsI/penicillin-binding protein 2